jgi:hypothetical protein
MHSIFKIISKLMLVVGLTFAGIAMAQPEPSMSQIYATAQAGKLDDAQVMVQQVLISHPKSAKAHFVQAELYARQGKLEPAKAALASAEQYAPGLPFAKPEAVQALRAQINAKPPTTATTTYAAPQAPAASSSSWLLPVVLAGGVIGVAFLIFRRRDPQAQAPQAAYAPQAPVNTLSGPQNFGMANGGQPLYPQGGYPQGAYPQQGGTGLGGRIMGGVATGLAVGAGVMAAEAIGRNLMGGHNNSSPQNDMLGGGSGFQPIAPDVNADMGGNNFGIADTSWDDGAASGSDWDN